MTDPLRKEQCPRCFGRGYLCRYPSKGGCRTFNCPRCNATGEVDIKWTKARKAQILAEIKVLEAKHQTEVSFLRRQLEVGYGPQ
jgi:hypothetical protein